MTPTPKWNEELPLNPRTPLPSPRKFEITIDNGKPIPVVIKRSHFPRPPQGPIAMKSMYDIRGTSLREDEIMERAADTSREALIVDRSGNIHRPGEDISPAGVTMSMGQPFFPPTYVGTARIPEFPSGNVITRRRLRNLIRSGRLKKPPNMVNTFPPSRIRRQRGPVDKRLRGHALALVNPGAYHGLVIPPSAGVKMSAAMLGYGLAAGRLRLGRDGSVYQNEMGVLKKIGRVVKKGAKGVGKGVKTAGKGVAKGAKTTAKFVKKNVAPIAMTAALGPAGLAAYAGVKNRKKLVAVAQKVGKWTGKTMAAAAKAVARVAATPIRLAVRPAVNAALRSITRGKPATPAHKKAASNLVIARLKANVNPLAKFSGLVLSYVGTGVGGSSMAGINIVARDTAIGNGMVSGCARSRASGPTVVGLTGVEISAMASAAVAAITPIVKNMAAEFAKTKGEDLVKKAISPSTKKQAAPPEIQVTEEDVPDSPIVDDYPEEESESSGCGWIGPLAAGAAGGYAIGYRLGSGGWPPFLSFGSGSRTEK